MAAGCKVWGREREQQERIKKPLGLERLERNRKGQMFLAESDIGCYRENQYPSLICHERRPHIVVEFAHHLFAEAL
jgi:hypothetical protein